MHKNLPLILTNVNTTRGKKYTKSYPSHCARAVVFIFVVLFYFAG